MVNIKILGTGCPKCQALKKVTAEALEELQVEATIQEVKDINAILEYPIMFTPGLVVNEKLVLSGEVPSKGKLVEILKGAIEG